MSTARLNLPSPTEAQITKLITSLKLPLPLSILPFSESTGAYHSIFTISFPSEAPLQVPIRDGQKTLILRVSGTHIPTLKTQNEVAIMRWVMKHTTIPIPALIAYDVTSNNVLESEFTLLEKADGVVIGDVIEMVEDKEALVSQLANYLTQLHAIPFQHVGGLTIDCEDFSPGPMTTFDFFGAWETAFAGVDPLTLNPTGPYSSYTLYLLDKTRKLKLAMSTHVSHKPHRDLPFESIEEVIVGNPEMNETRYVLAHRDLHLGNFLFDVQTQKITSVLDWELAAVLPYQLWNPGNFLWNPCVDAPTRFLKNGSDEENESLYEIFERLCKEGKLLLLDDAKFKEVKHQKIQRAVSLLGLIVGANIRGLQKDRAEEFRLELDDIISGL